MEPDERVRVKPVSTDAVPAVDHDHADVRMVDQGVRERHPHRTGTDHEVVGFPAQPPPRVHPVGATEAGQRRPEVEQE